MCTLSITPCSNLTYTTYIYTGIEPQILPTEMVYIEVYFQGDQVIIVMINLTDDDVSQTIT